MLNIALYSVFIISMFSVAIMVLVVNTVAYMTVKRMSCKKIEIHGKEMYEHTGLLISTRWIVLNTRWALPTALVILYASAIAYFLQ